ncbi:gliding motility-associated-like protein [Aquimarina sp. EL_43]|uniref:T9SS type B sorting domain-containing protein n=1 Tax=unclassified Aquimarina TaxID=2627091 RepID=UPI0018CAF75E|nr:MULTISPECIES: T9SS type B sorting domain-containing protein [unclassified Aquimarina]MBG6131738.1 gliding motility-associated-like protein [Aquimarina sp. EL_35]MBG6152199.1 gliding motility-associated-like protein [Aquimarina sp. EL_32]MBG6169857.1 gliding motility-associated-like protein [Aquimarina sp. EL_43]
MKLRLKSAIVLVFLMIGIQQISAQVPFTEVPNSTLRINGELKIIGNAIVGLNQSGFTPNDDYNGNASNNAKTFGYIDIDGDPSTFSSSSADLQLTSGCERIAYAGLYWSASYFTQMNPADTRFVQYTGLPFPDNRPDFRTIKIRPPGGGGYVTILPAQTQVIYDGYRNTATNPSNAAVIDIPYVCYADVTTLIQGLANANGTYTVADMRASTGFSGFNANGIAGGWVLVVAYEDPTLSAKYISTRQGYLNNQPCNPADPGCLKNFTYTGFQTLPAPLPVRARYSIATLEGDRPFTGDIFQIQRPDGVRQNIFTTPANPNGNFFDSSISVDGSYGNAAVAPIPGDPPIREPHSRNTLGFDADIFDIPNPGNTVIPNTPAGSTASATFFTTSTGDAYSVFFNSFQVEVIEPELTVTKRVLDNNGIDITGDPVNFADQLFYELTIENQGNEDITAASIRDVLPDNVDFTLGSITTSNPGVVATPDGTNRQIDITIADPLIVRNGGVHTVRFGVSVVATCADLRDACSNQINNVAISTYTGVESGITQTGEQSILDQDACGSDIVGSSNVLINDGICFTTAQPAFICTGSLTLTAGAGFSSYEWVNASSPGVVIGTNRDLVVTTAGTYIVTETGAPGCQDAQQTFNVDAFNTVVNPVVDIANNLGSNPNVNGNVRTCPITGDPLPEIFLCGAGTTLTIPTPGNTLGFPVGTTVEWQRLDPTDCPAVPRDPNCPTTDSGCDGDWQTLSTDINSFTISQAGEYRVNATFDSNCTIPFYFNVFQNNFDPDLAVIRQIICGSPGTIRVQNSSLQYEYQLITPITNTVIGYQNSAEFTGLTEVGTYTVNVRQVGGLPTACVFQETIFLDELDATETVTPTSPTCPGDQGQIEISVADSQINYRYIINSTTTTFNDTEGPTTVPNHTFTGLNPDTYNVQVLSADGSCSEVFVITINDPAAFSATIRLVEDLHCNPGYQPDPNLNDPLHPSYDPTAPPFDPDQFIAIYEVTVTGGSGNFAFNNQADFLGTVLAPITGTTYQFRATAAGNYPVFVDDLDNSCTIAAGSVDVSPYTAITATATAINPACNADSGSIQVTIGAGSTGPFTYILNQGTASEVTIGPTVNTSETFNNVDPSVSHTVTVQDGFGCDFTVTPDVTFTTPASITATINDDFRLLSCTATPGAQAQVTAITGGSGTYEWSLNPAGPFTAVGAIPFEIDFATDGSYTLYIRNQATDDCLTPFPITIDPILEVDSVTITPGDQDCSNQTVDVVVSASPALTLPAFYEYSITPDPATGTGATGTTPFSTTTAYTFTNGVLYTVTARRSDNQCVNTESFTGTTVPEIQITSATETNAVTCFGGADGEFSFTVGSSAAFTYTISGGTTAVPPGGGVGGTPVVIGPVGIGTYTITVTDTSLPAGNCTATTTVDITGPPSQLTLNATSQSSNCSANTGTITATAGGGNGNYQFELRDNTNTIVPGYGYPNTDNLFTGLAAGNYTVFVRDGNSAASCEVSTPVTVGQFSGPVIDAIPGGDVCVDTDPATQWIEITPDGTTPTVGPFEYDLTGPINLNNVAVTFLAPPNDDTFEIPNLIAGSYTVVVRNTTTNCVSNVENFTINPELTITATLTQDIDCNNPEATIEFTAAAGSGTYNQFDLYTPGSPPVLVPGGGNIASPFTNAILVPGDYVVGVVDDAGCTAFSNTITVTPFDAVTATLVPTNPTCNGDTDGTIEVTVTAGQGPFIYVLDGNAATQIGPTGDTTVTFNNVDDGAHTVTITDGSGGAPPCTFDFNTTLTDPAVLTPTITIGRELSCVAPTDAIIRITGIVGGSGSWAYSLNPASGYTNIAGFPVDIPITTAGTYTVYVANQGTPETCPIQTDITIEPVTEVTDLDFAQTPVQCPALTSNVTLTPTISGTGTVVEYEITAPAPVGPQALNLFSNLAPGTYTFLARTDDGCEYTENYVIEDVDRIVVNATPVNEPTCNGDSDGELSFTVTGIDIPATATYEYEITGGTPPIAPITATGQTAATIVTGDVLPGGNYTITVTDEATLCEATATVTINQPDVVDFDIDPVVQDCAANTNTVSISNPRGGSGTGYTYTLSDSGGVLVGPSRPASDPYLNVPNGTGYQLVVTDSNSCVSATQTLDINQLPQLDASVNASSDFCLDDGTVSFTIDIDGTDSGTPDYTYNVTRSGVVVIPDTNVGALTTFTTTPALTLPGDYVITVTDSNGCPVVLPTQTIAPAVELVATQVADITCNAANNPVPAEFSFAVNGGYTPYDIAVSIDGGAFADHLTNATAPFANYTNGTAGSYVFRVTDDRGCTFTTAPFTVTDPAAININAPTVNLDCDGDTGTAVIEVTGTEGPYEIDFQNTGTFVTIIGTEITFPNLGEAIYPFTVRSNRGCTDTGTVEITTPDPITEVSRVETPVTCGGSGTVTDLGAIDLEIAGGTANYTYTLVTAANFAVLPLVPAATAVTTPNPTTTGTTVRFEGLDFGQYFIFVTDANGCTDNAPFGPFNIFSPPNDLVQNITVSATCPGGVTFEIDVQGGSGVLPPANPPPGFDIRIVGEPSPGLGDFVPLDDSVGGATPVDANTPIRDHTYSGLDFNRTYVLEVRDNATGCLYQEMVPPESPPSEPNIINDVVTDVSCNETPAIDDGSVTFDVSAYDPTVTEISWEVFNAFTNVSLGAAYTGSDNTTPSPAVPNVPVTINNIPPGQYYVTIREVDGTQCPTRYDFTIDLPDPLTSVATNQTPANSCGTNAQVIMDTDGGTQFTIATVTPIPPGETADGYTYAVVPNGSGDPGVYPLNNNVIDLGNTVQTLDIWVADANGCSFGPVTVTTVVNPLPTVVAAFVDDCAYDNSNVISVTGGGLGTLTYQLDGGTAVTGSLSNTSHEFIVSTPGTYTIGVTDQTGCTVTTPVDVYGPLQISAAFTVAPDCTNATGTITTTITGVVQGTETFDLLDGTGTPVVGNTSGDVNGIYNLVAPGTYIVRVTDDGRGTAPGCSFDSLPISIEAPTAPVLVPETTFVTCAGDTDGVVTAALTPASIDPDPTVIYEYRITATTSATPAVVPTTYQTSPIFSGLDNGTYTVEVRATKPNGALNVFCFDTDDYIINDPTAVNATISSTPYGCTGTTENFPVITIDNIAGGTGPDYTISYTVDGTPVVASPVDPTTLDTDPAAGIQIVASVAGDYVFTIYDSNNCPTVQPTETIPAFPIMTNPIVTQVAPINCDAPNAELVTVSVDRITTPANINGYSFDLLPVGGPEVQTIAEDPTGTHTSGNFSLTAPGTYVFRITDLDTGCFIDTAPYTVATFNEIEANAAVATHVLCNGASTGELNLNVLNYTGEFNFIVRNTVTALPETTGNVATGFTNPVLIGLPANGLPAGNYVVEIEALDAPFCDVITDAVTITQPEQLRLTIPENINANCNEDARVTVSVTGGTGPYTFRADDDGIAPFLFETTTANTTETFLLPATIAGTTYVISAIDNNSCTSTPVSINETVFRTPDPTVDSVTWTDSCVFDDNYTIRVVGTSNVPVVAPATNALTFEIGPVGSGQVAGNVNGTTHDFTVTTPGTYTVRVYDENGCVSTDETVVIVPELSVSADFTGSPVCRSDVNGVITATVTGGSDFAANPANFIFTLTGTNSGGLPIVPVVQIGAGGNVFNNVTAGSYTVSVTDSNVLPATGSGCTASDTVDLPIPVDPIPTATPTGVSCVGASDGSVIIALQAGTDTEGPYSYQLYENNGGTLAITGAAIGAPQIDNPTFTGLSFNALAAPHPTAGEYLVEVTSARGCSALVAFVIPNASQVTASSSQTPYTCTGTTENFPDIIVTIQDGTPPYSITYTSPLGTVVTDLNITDADGGTPGVQYIFTGDEVGNYVITVTDSNGCNIPTPPGPTITETINPLPIMTNPLVNQVAAITCNAPNAELVTVSVDRITTPANINGYSFDLLPVGGPEVQTIAEDPTGTHTSGNFSLTTPGTYVFRITDLDTGCFIDTAPYIVAPFDTIDAAITLGNDITCFNTLPPDGSVNLIVTGYTGPYTYDATNTTTATVVSGGGDTTTDPATGLNIPGLEAGNIVVTVTATNTPFCDADSNTVAITQPPVINVTANQIQDETCAPGDDATVEAVADGGTGALQYQLEDAGGGVLVPFGSDPRFGGFLLDAGTAPAGIDYVVRVRDARGCEVTDTINIQPPTPLGLTAIAPTLLACSDSEDGTITAIATDGQGPGTYLFMLTFPDGSQSGAIASTTDRYVWNNLKPGNYIVTVTDNLACEIAQDPVIINAPPVVTIDVAQGPISCLTPSPNPITVTAGGGTPGGYEFSSDGTTFVAGNISATVHEFTLPAGDYNFYVRDVNGCVSPASNTIPVRDPVPITTTLDLSNTSIVCFGEPTGSIDASVTGGLGNYGYRVTGTDYLGNTVTLPGPLATDTQTTSFFGDLPAGTYNYTVTSGNCLDSVTLFEIRQPAEFIAQAFATPISCNGETDGTIRVTAVGGTSLPQYYFSLYDSSGNAVFTFIEGGSENPDDEHTFRDLPADTYRVEVEDGNGCPRTILDIQIIEPAPILATVNATTPEDCAGDMNGTATLSITGGLPPANPADPSYFWSIDGVTYQPVTDPANLFIDNLPGGTTTVFIRDSQNNANCQGAFNIDIEPGVNLAGELVPELVCPIFDYSDPTSPVMTSEEQYFVSFDIVEDSQGLGIIYTLNGINGTPNPPNNSNLTGNFEVTPGEYEGIMEYQGCTRTVDTIEILEYTPLAIPVAQMTNNPQDPNEYQIIASGGRPFENTPFYAFSFTMLEEGMTLDQLEPSDYTELDGNIFVIRQTADYVLRVVDADGCEVLTVQNLTYINIRIPNYFTPDSPNSTAEDRFWYPRQITPNIDDPFFFENMEVIVFDRYGRMLAEFKGDQQGWDGLYQGKQLPSGDYWYSIILNDVDNREFTGHFTLYR